MTDSERQQILKMIDDGKISAEQGLILMRALDEAAEEQDESPTPELSSPEIQQPAETKAALPDGSAPASDPEFDRKLKRFRDLWIIPLWLGVGLIVVGAYWMNNALQASGFGPWFFLAWLPFLAGVLLTALAFSSRSSRWIYINVKQKPGETPQRIVLAFPLFLVNWGLKFARRNHLGSESGAQDEVMNALAASTRSGEPFLVDVTEEGGEHVQVYIG